MPQPRFCLLALAYSALIPGAVVRGEEAKPAPLAKSAAEIDQLIKQPGSDVFDQREAASRALSEEEKGKGRADRVRLSPMASAVGEDGTQTITVTLKIDEGWVIYANAVGNEDLEEVRTVLNVAGERGLEQLSVEYPPGDSIKDRVVGNYYVYTGEVSVKVKVRRAKADRLPLSITVSFYPFDGKTCGTTVKQTVTLR